MEGGGIYFDTWIPPSNCIAVNNNTTGVYLYLKWKNIEASAAKSSLVARYHDSQLYIHDVYANVGPFNLSFPNPTFVGGATKNIPCHSTDPVTISLNPYINTADNGIDKDLEITSHFRWTLPSGWQTTGGKTGTFDAYSSITVIPPLSSSNVAILVQPYADAGLGTQYGPSVSLQITRNLESFSISGPNSVVYNSTYRYTASSYPGISYSWQLPIGWSGSSTTNYIDVTIGCGSGNIVATMTGCNGSKTANFGVTQNIIAPGTTISGSNIVCLSGTQFYVPGLASGTNITWNSSSNLTLSNASSNYCTYSANSNGEGWIEATINATACSSSITLPRKTVVVGSYSSSNYPITGPSSASCRQYVYYSIPSLSEVTSINWVWPSGWTYVSGQNTTNLALQTGTTGSSGTVAVQATNTCGAGSYATKYTSVTGICGYSLSVSPNPVNNVATIELTSTEPEMQALSVEWELEVYDQLQVIKIKTPKIKDKAYKLNIQGWKDGIYIIRAKIGDDFISEKMMVKH